VHEGHQGARVGVSAVSGSALSPLSFRVHPSSRASGPASFTERGHAPDAWDYGAAASRAGMRDGAAESEPVSKPCVRARGL
jgi:hypothetical protein